MTVHSVKLTRIFDGSVDKEKTEWTFSYKVVADLDDGPHTILPHEDLPKLGSTYKWGSDNSSFIRCTGIKPRRSSRRDGVWIIAYTFTFDSSFEPPERPEDEFGNPTTDPDAAAPIVRVVYRSTDEPIFAATFLGFEDNTGGNAGITNHLMPVGQKMPIQNSAMIPILPPLEEAVFFPALVVQQYRRHYSPTKFAGFVNSDAFQILFKLKGRTLMDLSVDKKEAYCAGQEWNPMITDDDSFWLCETEIWLGDWIHRELDRGICARAEPYDPDGSGGFIDPQNLKPGDPLVRRIRGIDGNPIDEPVALNGNGQPITSGGVDAAVYLAWQTKPLRMFRPLGKPILHP